MTPEPTQGSRAANGTGTTASDRPEPPPIPSFGGPEAQSPKSPPPHIHDVPPPPPPGTPPHVAPPQDETASSSKRRPIGLAVAALLAGAAAGFVAGRATAPRGRSALRLPFGGTRRRAVVVGGVTLAPTLLRGTANLVNRTRAARRQLSKRRR